MARRFLKALGWLVLAVVLIAAAALATLAWRDQATLTAQAQATPQLPASVAAESSVADLRLPPDVNVQTANLLRPRRDVLVVDVRSPAEFAAAHVPGAINIPLAELTQRIDELPPNRAVIVTCRTGRRSSEAARILRSEGLDNVHNLVGGLRAWQKAGLPTE